MLQCLQQSRRASRPATPFLWCDNYTQQLVLGRCFAGPRPYLSGPRHPSFGIELLMRVRMQCLAVHARTSKYSRNDDSGCVRCPACGSDADGGETLHHLIMFLPCSMARRALFEGVSSVPVACRDPHWGAVAYTACQGRQAASLSRCTAVGGPER